MSKDVLFMLPPGFFANQRREYCPECAELWGVLSWFPAIKESLEIRYVGIEHPRGPICAVLGEGRFNAPTLVLARGHSAGEGLGVKTAGGRDYIDNARGIGLYFAGLYGTPVPRGSALA